MLLALVYSLLRVLLDILLVRGRSEADGDEELLVFGRSGRQIGHGT